MPKFKSYKALIILSLLTATLAVAEDPQSAEPTASGQAGQNEPVNARIPDLDVNRAELEANPEGLPVHPDLNASPEVRRDELMSRLVRVQQAADDRLVQLKTRLESAHDSASSLVIIKEMEQVKVNSELDMLRVQAAYAREKGLEEVAVEIEASLAEMTTPRAKRQPVDRSADRSARQ